MDRAEVSSLKIWWNGSRRGNREFRGFLPYALPKCVSLKMTLFSRAASWKIFKKPQGGVCKMCLNFTLKTDISYMNCISKKSWFNFNYIGGKKSSSSSNSSTRPFKQIEKGKGCFEVCNQIWLWPSSQAQQFMLWWTFYGLWSYQRLLHVNSHLNCDSLAMKYFKFTIA